MNVIERALRSARELAGFCTQSGWIDNDTLHYRILHQTDHQVLALVQFEEIVLEATGNVASRNTCGGRVRIHLDRYGDIDRIELE